MGADDFYGGKDSLVGGGLSDASRKVHERIKAGEFGEPPKPPAGWHPRQDYPGGLAGGVNGDIMAPESRDMYNRIKAGEFRDVPGGREKVDPNLIDVRDDGPDCEPEL